jgi:ribosomal protein S6--L-glutamate ligase
VARSKRKLRIGILDFSGVTPSSLIGGAPSGGSIRKVRDQIRALKEAIIASGHTPVIYKVEDSQLFFDKKSAEILYKNHKIKGCDVLLPRIDFSLHIDLELSIIKQFQMMGIPVVNKYLPIARAKNKLRTMQILTNSRIPVPRTVVVRRFEYLDEAIKSVGGYPVILKVAYGTYGIGVVLLESRRSLYSTLDILWKYSGSNLVLIQEYVSEAQGSDYRAFVVGDKVVAAMRRTAKAGDFRSNLDLGGEAVNVKLDEHEEKLAVRATEALNLDLSGVDIIRSNRGPVIMEINANPGIAGITSSTGVDVASEVVKYAVKTARKKLKK